MRRPTHACASLAAALTAGVLGLAALSGCGGTGGTASSSPSASSVAGSASSSSSSAASASSSSGVASATGTPHPSVLPTHSTTRSVPPSTPATSPQSSAPVPLPSGSCVTDTVGRLSVRDQAAQLVMTGIMAGGVTALERKDLEANHPGGVLLLGHSGSVDDAREVTSAATGAAGRPDGIAPLVAADQEGGKVQRLSGTGFSEIPSARTQGGWSMSHLTSEAQSWGKELRAAGVTVDLAPVADVVPADDESGNPPIGQLDRGFGPDVDSVGTHVAAFVRGMHDAGVITSVKHFPGLGRVTGNTDVTAGVTDTVTTRHDPDLAAFAAGIKAGSPMVMVSTAEYSRIDPGTPAAFSSTIVTGMLRGDLGYSGVVISDDLGAAAQVASVAPGQRAVRFVAAGGDIAVTGSAGYTDDMIGAIAARAGTDPAFAAQVRAAATRVVALKYRFGLLSCGG